jgi:hypothetical protein
VGGVHPPPGPHQGELVVLKTPCLGVLVVLKNTGLVVLKNTGLGGGGPQASSSDSVAGMT